MEPDNASTWAMSQLTLNIGNANVTEVTHSYNLNLDGTWIQHYSHSPALQHIITSLLCMAGCVQHCATPRQSVQQPNSHLMQLKRHRMMQAVLLLHLRMHAVLTRELTREMGGRFFLNFARIAPMLPCALVTCASSWQASGPDIQVQAL